MSAATNIVWHLTNFHIMLIKYTGCPAACRLFERGLAYVGMDYLSHGLWDKYLAYELSLGAHATVAQLYLRLLRMPIQRLDEYRTR